MVVSAFRPLTTRVATAGSSQSVGHRCTWRRRCCSASRMTARCASNTLRPFELSFLDPLHCLLNACQRLPLPFIGRSLSFQMPFNTCPLRRWMCGAAGLSCTSLSRDRCRCEKEPLMLPSSSSIFQISFFSCSCGLIEVAGVCFSYADNPDEFLELVLDSQFDFPDDETFEVRHCLSVAYTPPLLSTTVPFRCVFHCRSWAKTVPSRCASQWSSLSDEIKDLICEILVPNPRNVSENARTGTVF